MQWRCIYGINTTRFEAHLCRSVLRSQPSDKVHCFTNQQPDVVVGTLKSFTPVRDLTCRPPNPITGWLSCTAVEAKRLHRQLERRWKRYDWQFNRVAYSIACLCANKLINCSHHKYFLNQIANATACKDKPRSTKHILYSDSSSLVRTVVESIKLSTEFYNKIFLRHCSNFSFWYYLGNISCLSSLCSPFWFSFLISSRSNAWYS